MKKLYRYSCLFLLVFLNGCSTSGPMASLYGPVETPGYENILEASLYNSEAELQFVSEASQTVNHRVIGGALTVTERGIMFSRWDYPTLKYDPVTHIEFDSITKYGSDLLQNTPLGLFTKGFYITSDERNYYFASDKLDSIFYFIKSRSKQSERIDI